MAKAPAPHQMNLFEETLALLIGSLARRVKMALREAAGRSGLSREEIIFRAEALAEEAGVSLCAGGALGKATFDKWLDLAAPGHMPGLLAVTILAKVLNDAGLLAPALEALGLGVMTAEDRKYCDLGRAARDLELTRQRIRKIKEAL